MRIPRRPHPRLVSIPLAAIALLAATGIALGGGETTSVEGGAFFDYVAPDPVGTTDGTIRFGFLGTAETIAFDAELVPPVDTNLPGFGGGTPTCLEVTRAGGIIIRLAFIAECVVEGDVTFVEDLFGPGGDAYMISDRLAAPAEFIATSPEFAALIGVPADAGTVLSVTFTLDMATGVPVSFVGVTSVSGPVTLLAGGDITVDGATLQTEVIDDASRAALTEASELGVDATVAITGNGNLQAQGPLPELEIVLAVSFTAPTAVPTTAPTPAASLLPDTGLSPSGDAPAPGTGALAALALVTAGAGAAWIAARRRRITR
jgi:hypothetical protein